MHQQKFYRYCSELLNYPTPRLEDQARTCVTLLVVDYPEAAQSMQKFLDGIEGIPPGRLEEIYTGTFDVSPTCFIYAGYILFGESFKRGRFMVRLQEEYYKYGFDRGNELADHLAVIMRFLSKIETEDEFTQSLKIDCLIPVLAKMIAGFNQDGQNPYFHLLHAIISVLEKTQVTVPAG